MSSSLEFEGKSVEKAVEKACEAIKIPREKLKYDVISYGSTGIFGLVGSKKARIRVNLSDLPPEYDREPLSEVKTRPGDSESDEESIHPPDIVGKEKKRLPVEELGLQGETLLRKIIDTIASDARITTKVDPDRIEYDVRGGNSALIIGKHGQTLEAIQYVIEKAVNRQLNDPIKVQVDVEGYLINRRTSLQQLAERLAQKVKRTGKPVTVGQMNSYERKVIHLALKDDDKVRTQSKGEGQVKTLTIIPRQIGKRKREKKE
ncbi:MAG: RNA-binding cell elongation regulator Jag/EloR [Thermodesulfobacteriota bacterium]